MRQARVCVRRSRRHPARTRLFWIAIGALLVAGVRPAAGAPALVIDGDFDVLSGLFTIVGPMAWRLDHTNGFGDGSSDAGSTLPQCAVTGLYSQTHTTPTQGESFGEIGGCWDFATPTTVEWNPSPMDITLTQSDFDPGTANDPARLFGVVHVAWHVEDTSGFLGPWTTTFQSAFDVATDFPAGFAEFSLQACSYLGDDFMLGTPATVAGDCASLGGIYDGGSITTADFNNAGGTVGVTGLHSITPGAFPPASTSPRYTTAIWLDLQVKNDTGPATIRVENFSFTAEATEPGVAVLLGGVLALRAGRLARHRA